MNNDRGQIAILLAAKDGGRYIGELLESLENQTCSDFTVYLHDDGSTDDTLDIYGRYHNDKPEKYKVLEGPPQYGARENFFYLLGKVEADYYLFADDDDVWKPEKIDDIITAIKKVEESRGIGYPAAAFCDMRVVDQKLNEIAPSFIRYMGRDASYTAYTQILIDNPAAGCSMGLNRALRDIAIGCEDISRVEMHDAWVMMVGAVFGTVIYVPEVLVDYRQHGDNELGAATENIMQKITRNLGVFFSGRMKAKKKEFFELSRGLAGEILKLKGVPGDKAGVLQGYLDMQNYGRLYRIRYCRQHHIERAHHSAWMRLWI
ncbi:MAG: glycosyltransferase [Lachnospiraceae bacterium]|nr:glycosyltransferase [Lachnospiraceae bacterium]